MKHCVFLSLIALLPLSSCMDKDVYRGEQKNKPLNPSEVFDFKLNKDVTLNVDYGFKNDYYIVFQLYAQNPMKETADSWEKDESIQPIYTSSTDKQGKHSEVISLSSDISEVWLYTDYLNALSPVRLEISANGEINYNQADYIASLNAGTRGITSAGHNYLDDWMLMPGVDWDAYGLPTNIEPQLSLPPASTLYSIKKTYNKVNKEMIGVLHTGWIKNNATSEVKIVKDTELSLVFMQSNASWKNTVGYFTYPTGTVPTEESIRKVVAFPNATPITKILGGQRAGSLLCGHEVKLKYWNEKEQQFQDKFPAGVTVGWCLEGQGFADGNLVSKRPTCYSYSSMNKDNVQYVVALRDSNSDRLVAIGFEDNAGKDYADALFCLKVAEPAAVDAGKEVLPLANPPANFTNTVKGTLAYEDQWPSVGDYDMNDVVMEYQSTIYQNALNNQVYKIVDEFTPVNNGASYTCGFGYQLHKISSDRVISITVEGPEGWSIEEDQAHPTVLLFNSIRNVMKQKFTITTELADVDKANVQPPYNPFIFVKDRSTEVHLVNYPPTSKANQDLFNTKNDVSNPSAGVYYITPFKGEVNLMPYGINIPVLNFKVTDENEKIYDAYPRFVDWAKSGGKTNTDWYK